MGFDESQIADCLDHFRARKRQRQQNGRELRSVGSRIETNLSSYKEKKNGH